MECIDLLSFIEILSVQMHLASFGISDHDPAMSRVFLELSGGLGALA
jgi:hypothetical protein